MSEEPITPNPEHHSGIKEALARAVLVGAGITAAMGIGGAAHADEAAPTPAPTTVSQEASPAAIETSGTEESPTPEPSMPPVNETPSPEPSAAPIENVINDNNMLLGSSSASPKPSATPLENIINDNDLLQDPKELPNTGSPTDILPLAGLGTGMVIAGGAAVAAGRKPEDQQS